MICKRIVLFWIQDFSSAEAGSNGNLSFILSIYPTEKL
jgi:hypothetical protein